MATKKAPAKKAASKKKVVVKPTEKVLSKNSYSEEVEITNSGKNVVVVNRVTEIKEIPSGTFFTAMYNGRPIEGVVFRDKENDEMVYFLNNFAGEPVEEEDVPSLGFAKVISINTDWNSAESEGLKNLACPEAPEDFDIPEVPEKIAGYYPVIMRGKVKFGCQEVTNEQIENLYNMLEY